MNKEGDDDDDDDDDDDNHENEVLWFKFCPCINGWQCQKWWVVLLTIIIMILNIDNNQ